MITWVSSATVPDQVRAKIRGIWRPSQETEQSLLEVAGSPGVTAFAVLYRDTRTGSFDWSVFTASGTEDAGGWRLTQPEARADAEEALALIT